MQNMIVQSRVIVTLVSLVVDKLLGNTRARIKSFARTAYYSIKNCYFRPIGFTFHFIHQKHTNILDG